MKITINAKGLACPQPVILARKNMNEYDEIEILVDNPAAVENLTRLARSSGWIVSTENTGDYFRVVMMGNVAVQCAENTGSAELQDKEGQSFTVVLASDVMGNGDNELGAVLMKAFIHTLVSGDKFPSSVLFYNSGVMLAAEGSDVLDDLVLLEKSGAELLVCGTCVNYFGLGGRIRAGKVSNMYDILEAMKQNSCIIRP